MNKLTSEEQKAKEIAIEKALVETRVDITAGKVVKESAAAHVKRLKRIVAKSSKTLVT